MPEAVIRLPHLPPLINLEDDVLPSLWRGAAAEFFATLIFVFVGTGAVVACQTELGKASIGVPSVTLIAIAHGFTITVLVYAVGEISGGHINPAVSWAVMITGKQSVIRTVVYIISQLFGGIVGSSFLKSLLTDPKLRYNLGCHSINPLLTPGQGFLAEIFFTFIFIFVVFGTAISPFAGKFSPLGGEGPGKLTPFAVGMTILILHTVGVPFTGASMNPARSFGPALVRGGSCWNNHWIYWAGPFVGSTIAAVTAHMLFLSTPRDIFRLNNSVDTTAKRAQTPPQQTTTQTSTPKRQGGAPKKIVLSSQSQQPVASQIKKTGSEVMEEETETVPLEDIQ